MARLCWLARKARMTEPVLFRERHPRLPERLLRGGSFHFAALKGILPRQAWQRVSHRSTDIWANFSKGVVAFFRRRMWALGFTVLFLFFAGAVAFAQPKRSEATLVVSSGRASVMASRTSIFPGIRAESMLSAGDIMAVSANDEISVMAGSSAQLRLYDGSTVDLFENSTLQVNELLTDEDSYRVRLHMLSGKTVSRVIRLLGVGDAFEVSTPSSTASVRGTVFTVAVLGPDSSFIACDEGVVHVEMGDLQADVVAGTELMAISGQTLQVVPQQEADPPVPPIAVPGNPPERGGDPPGPPDQVPGNPPGDVPGNPPEEGGDPPGPPDQVPGNPPEGEGEPPAASPEKARDKPPKDVPVVPQVPVDPPPVDLPESESPPKGNPLGPPDAVPGKPPEDPPGQGDPPDAGGPPPGQVNPNKNPSSSGSGTDTDTTTTDTGGGGNGNGGGNGGGNGKP